MESDKTNKITNSRTNRSTKRTQAYKNGTTTSSRKSSSTMRSSSTTKKTTLVEQERLSRVSKKSVSLDSKAQDSSSKSTIKLKVSEPKRVKVESKKISPEELAQEKARQERIIKREQKFKEEQKRRIEEIIEQQKTREQKNKSLAQHSEKENNLSSKVSSQLTTKTTKKKTLEETPKKEISDVERVKREKQLDEILMKKPSASNSYTPTHSKKSLSIDDFTINSPTLEKKSPSEKKVRDEKSTKQEETIVKRPSSSISKTKNDNIFNIEQEANNSISKNEEKELLDKIGKINELELTNRIHRLTKEVLSDVKEETKAKKKPERQINADAETLNKATKMALTTLEKQAKIDKKELKKNKKNPKKAKTKSSASKKKGSKKSVILLILILLVSISVFVYSAFNIVKWQKDNIDTKAITDDINEIVDVQDVPDSENVEIIDPPKELPKSNPYWDYIKVPLKSVDFNELKAKNKETVGFIKVNGTNINYPFVQTKNNSYYLSHSFDKSTNQAGWVFMDYRNNVKDFDRNNIIYAHGRLDTTMFGSLKNILSSGWLKNKDNYIIWLSTEYENTLWQVFSVYRIKTTNDYIQVVFDSDEEFSNFAKMLINRSAHNFNTTVAPTDKILTLSTCYNQTDKVVLHAKLIKVESRS